VFRLSALSSDRVRGQGPPRQRSTWCAMPRSPPRPSPPWCISGPKSSTRRGRDAESNSELGPE